MTDVNPPMPRPPADETRPYSGPGRDEGHAVAKNNHGADHGQEGPFKDLEPIGTGKAILFGAIFVVLFAVLFVLGFIPRHNARGEAEKEVADVANDKPVVGVARPKPPTVFPTLEVPGDAQAFQITSIYPRASGYLKRRLVDIGDVVKEGQLLAEIETPEVEAQLNAAKANLQLANATGTKAKDDYDLAEATYQRYENFAKTGGVTQQQLDEKRSAFTSAKSTLAGAQASVRAGEAEVQRLTALIGFTQITAPFAGTITTRGYDVGALLSANNGGGRELFQIAQVDTLRVFVDVPQSYATFMKIGQPVKFAVTNYPGNMFDGFIARTSGSINQASRTMRVEADFPNKEGLLYPGMYGTLKYEARQKMEDLIIPSSALVFGAEGMRVAVVDDQDKVRFQSITVGADLGVEVQVSHGLKGGERIVANPGERLIDGVEVKVIEKTEEKPAAAQTTPEKTPSDPQKPVTAEAAVR